MFYILKISSTLLHEEIIVGQKEKRKKASIPFRRPVLYSRQEKKVALTRVLAMLL